MQEEQREEKDFLSLLAWFQHVLIVIAFLNAVLRGELIREADKATGCGRPAVRQHKERLGSVWAH